MVGLWVRCLGHGRRRGSVVVVVFGVGHCGGCGFLFLFFLAVTGA